MPVSFDWHDDQHTVLLWQFSGHWTWREYYDAVERVKVLYAEHDQRIDHIADMRASQSLPPDPLAAARRLSGELPPGVLTILVGASPMLQFIISMARRLFHGPFDQFYFADALEQAEADLRRLRGASSSQRAPADDKGCTMGSQAISELH